MGRSRVCRASRGRALRCCAGLASCDDVHAAAGDASCIARRVDPANGDERGGTLSEVVSQTLCARRLRAYLAAKGSGRSASLLWCQHLAAGAVPPTPREAISRERDTQCWGRATRIQITTCEWGACGERQLPNVQALW